MWQLINLLAFENLTPLNWEVVIKALNILWQGLVAIFVVIGLIIISVKVANFAINKVNEMKANREANKKDDNSQH